MRNVHISLIEVRKVLSLFVCVLFCSLLLGQKQSLTDEQFFEALNFEQEGLQEVRKCVNAKNYTTAKKAFVSYLKHREKPVWYFDWTARTKEGSNIAVDIKEADRYVKNDMLSCGIWHQFSQNIDWTHNPTPNRYSEWTWQLNRHHAWETLGKAYWKTSDEKYAECFVSQLRSWLAQCVKPNESGNKVGSPWRTLEAGIRMQDSWPKAFFYFLSSPSFDDESIFLMVKSIYEHGEYLRRYNSSDNWLTKEMTGLYTVGAMFPEFRASSEWRLYAAERLYNEEKEQFYPDGAQRELSTGYHITSLSNIVSVYKLAMLNNYHLPSGYALGLENAYEYFQKIRMPDGRLPAVNDAGWEDCRLQLANAAELFKKRSDFIYMATGGKEGEKPAYSSIWMPWAGWYVMRSGWDKDAFYAFFEVGPYGTGHQHEDKLSFILSAYGSHLITECGLYAYDDSKWRLYSTSSRGHNVARVDGMDQNRHSLKNYRNITSSLKALENKFVSTKQYVIGEGFYTEGFGPDNDKTVIHHRTLKFIKNGYWLLTDEFVPSDNMEHTFDIWFHFNTEKYRYDKNTNTVYSCCEESANVAVVRLGELHDVDVLVGAESPEVQGWVTKMNIDGTYARRAVATPVFHGKGKGIYKEYFVFIPIKNGDDFEIKKIKKVSSNYYKIECGDKILKIRI